MPLTPFGNQSVLLILKSHFAEYPYRLMIHYPRKRNKTHLNKGWPTRWHLLYYILLNMIQTLIRPSSGASEYLCCVGKLEACWCYVAGLSVGDVVSECKLKHYSHVIHSHHLYNISVNCIVFQVFKRLCDYYRQFHCISERQSKKSMLDVVLYSSRNQYNYISL